MRTTIVPAQVTTVEDKVAGNISISQLMLFIAPVFIGSLLFVLLPPFFDNATYKLVLILCIVALCAVLAIRVKGKIVLFWITVLLKYNMRPKYYVFDKNSNYLRDESFYRTAQDEAVLGDEVDVRVAKPSRVSTADIVYAEHIMAHPGANFHVRLDKKGKLSVHLTEI